MTTERIVVTGAAGFIGCNTVRALNAQGRTDLLLVDDLGSDDRWSNLVGLRFDDLVGSAAFLDALPELTDVSAIVHLGACSSTTETDADYLLENNYRYTRRLAEWTGRTGARFVYASSAATYGDGRHGYDDDDAITPSLAPLNMYGYSKHLFDLWALRTGELERMVGLKFFNVFGPFEEHKGDMRSVVSKAHAQIRESGSLQLFRSHREGIADGEQRRDFVFVDDAVRVVLAALDDPRINGLFNCGSGQAHTWNELAAAVFAAMGRDVAIDFVDMPEAIRDKYQYFTEANMGKWRATGADVAFTPLDTAVARSVAWLDERASA